MHSFHSFHPCYSFVSLCLVIRVKGIPHRSSSILIKMTLIPDRKPLECNTRAVPHVSGSAAFNEKFTFEINNDDLHKRLCFSIYNYQQDKNDMQLQGCLSFGIKNTLAKQRVSISNMSMK
jgi:hypothetical protein